MRIVRTTTGDVRIDPSGRLAGRGAYLCRDVACWERSLDKGGLSRALSVSVTPELRALVAAGPDQATTTTNMTTMTTVNGGGSRGEE